MVYALFNNFQNEDDEMLNFSNDCYSHAIHKIRRCTVSLVIATVALSISGCAMFEKPIVYRGVAPQEADAIIARYAGTAKPKNITMSPYYTQEEKYVHWTSTWNCNHQRTRIVVKNLVVNAGPGNFVEGTQSEEGDCVTTSTDKFAGRYDDNYFYLYWTGYNNSNVFKYQIRGGNGYYKGQLTFLGHYNYANDVWTFHKARDNPSYGLSGMKVAESGGPADMWESTEYMPQSRDPRLTTAQRKQDIKREVSAEVNGIANDIAGRQAARDADDREDAAASRAAALAKLNSSLNTYAAENAQRRNAEAERLAAARRATEQQQYQQSQQSQQRQQSQQSQQRQQPQSSSSQTSQTRPTQLAQTETRSSVANDNAVRAAAALKAQQDLEKKRQEDAQRAKEASDRAREQEQNRQRIAKENADKLAAEQAEKAAEQQKQKDYLAAMVQGIRLVATTCPGGEGHYYATGSMPRIKHKAVSCIDVYYEASCPGSRVTSNGIAKTFIGMSGCFGDTYQIDPKPACPAKEVQIRVTDVRPGCN